MGIYIYIYIVTATVLLSNLMERSAPEKKIVHGIGTGNVGAPATQDSFAQPKKKKRMMVRT
jgi:hypothetical protein